MSIGILVDILYNVVMSKLLWNISKLRNWDKNPRAIKSNKFQELKERIKKYGQFKPVITTLDGEVIGGNMRLRAMKDLGIQEIWVSVVEPKTNAEKIEIALADNEEMGYYQEDQLAELISEYKNEIKLESFSIHLGDGVNLEDLLNKYQPEEIIEDEAPEVEEEAISELGALYQLGNHRLMCGDSTNIEHVEMLMGGKKADMLFTDPPYNVDYTGKTKNSLKIQNDNFDDSTFFQFLYDAFLNMSSFLKEGASYYVCHAASEGINFSKALKDTGFLLKQCIIWNKNTMVMGRQDYHWKHEPILYGWKDGGSHKWYGDRKQVTVWDLDRPLRNAEHPTMKPLKLIEKAINNSSKTDDIVMDLFGGSGSTLITCEQTQRINYSMELDPRYVDVIRKRYAKFIGKENEWQEVTPRIN